MARGKHDDGRRMMSLRDLPTTATATIMASHRFSALSLLAASASVFLIVVIVLLRFSPILPQSPLIGTRCDTIIGGGFGSGSITANDAPVSHPLYSPALARIHFPSSFVFGTASSAFQVCDCPHVSACI